MRSITMAICLILSFTLVAQEDSEVKDSAYMPSSIFAVDALAYRHGSSQIQPLRLTGYKFLVTDFFNNGISNNSLQIDFRNIGRRASVEDIANNHEKAWYNKYDISRNTDHFIWNMGTIHTRKQWQRQNEQIKINQ